MLMRNRNPLTLSMAGATRAFSILEMLVGFAVLSVLVALLLAAFSNFSEVTSTSRKRVEVNKQPRIMFDRMAFDINSSVSSGGVRMGFRKNDALAGGTASKDDVLVLLTDAKSSDPAGRLAKIGYGVGPYDDKVSQTTRQTVLRYVEPFLWSDDTTEIELTNAASPQPIAPGILRFELAFVDEDGSIHAAPPNGPANSDAVRAFYDGLAAIICTVATLDEDSLRLLSPADRETISNRLDDAVDGQAPMMLWQAAGFSDLPQAVSKGLRFHQRYFRLK